MNEQLFYENVFDIVIVYEGVYMGIGREINVICLLVNFLTNSLS